MAHTHPFGPTYDSHAVQMFPRAGGRFAMKRSTQRFVLALLIGIMMVQRYPGSTVAASFQTLVYQTLTRSDYMLTPQPAPSARARRSIASTTGHSSSMLAR